MIFRICFGVTVTLFSVLFDIFTDDRPHRYACYNNKQIQLT